jgi:hypothetical protein
MLLIGTRTSGEFETLRYALHAAYSAALIWYLVRTGPDFAKLPSTTIPRLLRWRGGVWIPVVIIAAVFSIALFDSGGTDLVFLFLILGTIGVLAAYWRKIRARWILQGVLLALAAYLVGRIPAAEGMISQRIHLLMSGLAAPMYLAGAVIVEYTGLGRLAIGEWRLGEASRSWLWGLLLFLPMGMINAASGSPGGEVGWVSEWWMPIILPWYSGLTEEVWFRLIMVGLVYLFLRPAFPHRPALTAVLAMTFSAVIFGLGHGHNLERLLVTGLLYWSLHDQRNSLVARIP